MSVEKDRVDAYLDTVGRLEPDIVPTDASAYGTSIAVSLKRIADALERAFPPPAPPLVCTHGKPAAGLLNGEPFSLSCPECCTWERLQDYRETLRRARG